jgi:hypothetical protein
MQQRGSGPMPLACNHSRQGKITPAPNTNSAVLRAATTHLCVCEAGGLALRRRQLALPGAQLLLLAQQDGLLALALLALNAHVVLWRVPAEVRTSGSSSRAGAGGRR